MNRVDLRWPQVPLYRCEIVIFIALFVITLSRSASLEELSYPLISPCNLTSNFTLDCSNLHLTAIPKNIPNTIEHLNLSHNSLEGIEEGAFDECCENLKVLLLSHNGISTLNRRNFEKLKKLEIVSLDSNEISALPADTFQSHFFLKRLDLSHNPIELKRSPLLYQQTLEELNLDYCKLEEIPEETFQNMTQLLNLTLVGNPFDQDMDVSGFEPLTNLIRLKIPNLSESTTFEICGKLTGIDLINFDSLNISCTILSDDRSFDESIITNDPIEEPKVQPLEPPTTRKPSTTTTTTQEPPTTVSVASPLTLLPAVNNETSTSDSKIETSDSANKAKEDTVQGAIDVNNDTIKFILVGIFAVTVVGILIGLICRADVCGIKTKMCRSKKSNRRQEAETDTVSPFEEIPLKTVVNGITNEGEESSEGLKAV